MSFHNVFSPAGPLKVVVPTESVSAYLGDSALLRCEVSGDPPPVIRWQKNREDLPLTFDPDSRLATLPSGALQVSRVQPPDSATYRCLADNPGSTRTGSDAELRVLPGKCCSSSLPPAGDPNNLHPSIMCPAKALSTLFY